MRLLKKKPNTHKQTQTLPCNQLQNMMTQDDAEIKLCQRQIDQTMQKDLFIFGLWNMQHYNKKNLCETKYFKRQENDQVILQHTEKSLTLRHENEHHKGSCSTDMLFPCKMTSRKYKQRHTVQSHPLWKRFYYK